MQATEKAVDGTFSDSSPVLRCGFLVTGRDAHTPGPPVCLPLPAGKWFPEPDPPVRRILLRKGPRAPTRSLLLLQKGSHSEGASPTHLCAAPCCGRVPRARTASRQAISSLKK